MSDSKVEGPNSDPTSGVNVDALLAEVKQMADRVENLIGNKDSKPSPTPPAASDKASPLPEPKRDDSSPTDSSIEESAAQIPDAPADAEVEEVSEATSPSPEETSDQASDSGTEIHVDANTDKLAEDEINGILSRIDKKKQDTDEEAAEQLHRTMVIQSMPKPFKTLLVALMAIDRMFLWMPRGVKDILGLVGISTLLLAVILWIIIFVSGS